MKKFLILIVSFLALCVFSACENNTAANGGSYENSEMPLAFETTADEAELPQSLETTVAETELPRSLETTAAETELPQNLFYKEVSIKTLLNDLHGNTLKATRTYLNERLVIHGLILGSGSNEIGDFVKVKPDDEDSWDYIVCYFTNDSQIDAIMDKNDGDPITIKGIVNIDEFSGYSMNIEDIYTVKEVWLHGFYGDTNLGDEIQISGLINDIEKSGSGDNIIYFMHIRNRTWSYSDVVKVKCILTEEQFNLLQNVQGYSITVQGTVNESADTNEKSVYVKYITRLSQY